MRNCVVLGSGRSGTSMVAGSLQASGYHLGEELLPPTESNPMGYFESRTINVINETLLAPVVRPQTESRLFWWLASRIPLRPRGFAPGQRWLAEIPLSAEVASATGEIEQQMRGCIPEPPFCLKDPRFSYTIDQWAGPLRQADPVVVVVFRNPEVTASSIVSDAHRVEYLRTLRVSRKMAIGSWVSNYSHVLAHPRARDWVFVHFNQFLYGDGPERIGTALDATVSKTFRSVGLDRSRVARSPRGEAAHMYRRLCELAQWTEADGGAS